MQVQCKQCGKWYTLSEERVREFGSAVTLPCPACAGPIEVRLATQPAPPLADTERLRKRILRSVSALPAMPQVAQQARKLLSDEHASFATLARIIETDQAMATRVLKLANSSYYGVVGTVTSLQHAAVVLGMRTLNELLTLACTSNLLGAQLQGYGFATGELWVHSLSTAYCCRELCAAVEAGAVDDAFSAGLIHDCGKLILDSHILERQAVFVAAVENDGLIPVEAERQVLGFDHQQIGAEICDKWSFPPRLTKAIQFHHRPRLQRHDPFVAIVHAGDHIAHVARQEHEPAGTLPLLDEWAAGELRLTETRISELAQASLEYVRTIMQTFDLSG